jgi:hypothetical protein
MNENGFRKMNENLETFFLNIACRHFDRCSLPCVAVQDAIIKIVSIQKLNMVLIYTAMCKNEGDADTSAS